MSDILRAPPVTNPISFIVPGRFLLAYAPKHPRQHEIYTFANLQARFPTLGGVLDLQRAPRRWFDASIEYHQIPLPGGPTAVPSTRKIQECLAWINTFHRQHPNKLLYVHCRHGINRTGLITALYLKQCGVSNPLQVFADKRGIDSIDTIRPHIAYLVATTQ